MDNRIKSSRANKRELVMPFQGEENLVVPKKGGFGQPDNDKFVNLTTPTSTSNLPDGNTQTSADTGINTGGVDTGGTGASSGTTLGGSSGGATSSGTHVSPTTIASQNQSANTESNAPTTQVNPIGTPAETTSNIPTNTSVDNQPRGATTNAGNESVDTPPPPTPVELPTFPDYNTMDCNSLGIEIASIKSTIATGRFVPEVGNAYNEALSRAEGIFTTKCNVPETPPIAIVTPPPIGGGFGGGGGGGLGDEPTNAPIEEEAPKSNYGWLWIVAIIGGLYFLTKKSNKS
jgi:hypothetical protein